MEELLEALQANPIILAAVLGLAALFIYSLLKKALKLLLFVAALGIAVAGYTAIAKPDSRTGQASRKVVKSAKDKAKRTKERVRESAKEAAEDAKEAAKEATEEVIEDAKEAAKEAAKDAVDDAVDGAKEAAEDAVDDAKEALD